MDRKAVNRYYCTSGCSLRPCAPRTDPSHRLRSLSGQLLHSSTSTLASPTARLSLALADSHFKRSHKWPSLVRRFSHVLMSNLLWKMRMWKNGLPSSRLGANVKTAALKGPWGLDDASVDSTILHRATLQSNIALKYQHQQEEPNPLEAQIQFRATVQMCSTVNSNTI